MAARHNFDFYPTLVTDMRTHNKAYNFRPASTVNNVLLYLLVITN